MKIGILAAFVAGLSALISLLLYGVDGLGHRIPGLGLSDGYAFAWVLAILFGASIFLTPLKAHHKKPLAFIWTAKTFVCLVAMLGYESYYALDNVTYFSHASSPYFPAQIFWANGTHNVTSLAHWIHQLIPVEHTYHSLKLIWAYFGLWGIYFFYLAICSFREKEDLKLFLVMGLFPSVLFWSSILNKDPIVFFGIGLYVHGALGVMKKINLKSLIFMSVGIVLMSFIRVWLGPLMLAPFLFVFLVTSKIKWQYRLGFFAVAGYAQLQLVGLMLSEIQIRSSADFLVVINTFSRLWAEGGSGMKVPEFHSMADIASFAPVGMFAALFRPLPGEIMNPFGLLAGIENLGLLALNIWGLSFLTKEHLKDRGIVFLFFTLIFWSFAYAFVSYQNLGTAVRFRLQVLPLLIMLPLMIRSSAVTRVGHFKTRASS